MLPSELSEASTLFEILSHGARPRLRQEKLIDVIVPVYNSRAFTLRCLRSLLAAHSSIPHEIIVINDASSDERLVGYLRTFAARGLITLLDNEQNLGFVQTVNRGMRRHADRDVLLLNSDTEVHGDWLDRMRRAAYALDNAGTVTPLSNNGTICSYPTWCVENPMPEDVSGERLDELCAACNAGAYVDVPTAIGHCMYIRRDCLDAVGLFDEEHFGRGYGEENDFCMRALDLGWRHLFTTDTFVYHFGGASFGETKAATMALAAKSLNALHPQFGALVGAHVAANPAAEFRRRLDVARLASSKSAALYVYHDPTGATPWHVTNVLARCEAQGHRMILLCADAPGKIRLQRMTVKDTPNLVFDCSTDCDSLQQALQSLGISQVYVHRAVDLPQPTLDMLQRLEPPSLQPSEASWTVRLRAA